jgi:hypothetical protein
MKCGAKLENVDDVSFSDDYDESYNKGEVYTGDCPTHGPVRQKAFQHVGEGDYMQAVADKETDPLMKRLFADYLCDECSKTTRVYGSQNVGTDGHAHWLMCKCQNHRVSIVIIHDADNKYDANFKQMARKVFLASTFDLRFGNQDDAYDVR